MTTCSFHFNHIKLKNKFLIKRNTSFVASQTNSDDNKLKESTRSLEAVHFLFPI